MYRTLSAVGIALVALTSNAYATENCTPSHKFETVTPGNLTVVTMVIPPFSIPSDGTIAGIDGEIIAKIAERECLTVKPIVADAKAVLQYVSTGQADVAIGNWFRTAARAKVMGVSDPVYLDSLGIFTKEGTTSLEDLAQKDVAVGSVQGYMWTQDLQKVFGSKLKLYPSPVALGQDLQTGRIHAGLDSYSVGIYAQQQGSLKGYKITHAEPDERVRSSVQPAQIAFVYSKNKEELGNAINAGLAFLHETGEIKNTLKKYGLTAQDGDVGEPRLVE